MKAKRVLIFPAGTEIAFEILNALKYSKFVEIYGGTSVDDHSEFVYKNLIKNIPHIFESDFLGQLNKAIEENKIDCIYPAHDSASVFFSEHINEINAQVIITDPVTTAICRSKKETYKYLADESFIPKIYEKFDHIKEYPVFIKPAVGQGSVGAKKINTMLELKEELNKNSSIVICEYLPGMEYTVDCFTDKKGKLCVVKIRDRQRVRAGISVRSKEYEPDDKICEIAHIINERLIFKGAWFFQVKKDIYGEYKLLEISPRIPGTMGLSRNMGINFPLLTLFVFWGNDVEIIDNNYDIVLDRAFYSAYKINYAYDHIYLDFDDTLTLNGKVNHDVMRFVYQAQNKGKKIHLISKHVGDIHEKLKELNICEGLFEEINIISPEDEKKNYIKEQNAIFIDDSFSERKKVKEEVHIAVFDVDMIESLIDWRM
jgi:Carbamoylphosphate synthase large subunit (split gene in MJ)